MMIIEYVTYDGAGNLTGGYWQEMIPEHQGCYIEVSDDQRRNWNLYRANSTRDGLDLLPAAPPSKYELNAPILAALVAIDAKSIRPLREGDTVRVAALEAQAVALRATLIP